MIDHSPEGLRRAGPLKMCVKFVVRYFFDKLPKHKGSVTKQRGVLVREKRKKCVCAAETASSICNAAEKRRRKK